MADTYAEQFAEARAIISRVVNDWPYQPPEVIGPEREAFARWLEANPFDMSASLAVLRDQTNG